MDRLGPKAHKFMVTLDHRRYSLLAQELEERRGKGRRVFKMMSQRISSLIDKGLLYEDMEKRAPAEKKEPLPVHKAPIALSRDDGTPMCCERPMVDFGDFYSCLTCDERRLKT